jgi:hypothetical protein
MRSKFGGTGGPEVLNWTAVDVDVAADMQSAGKDEVL